MGRKGVGSLLWQFHLSMSFLSRHRQQIRDVAPTSLSQSHRRASMAALKSRVPSLNNFPLDEEAQFEDQSPSTAPVQPTPDLVVPSSLIHSFNIV